MQKPLNCSNFDDAAILYAGDEFRQEERAAVEAHARACAACAGKLAGEINFQSAVASREQPADAWNSSGWLLARCRSQLAEALDDAAARRNFGWRGLLLPSRWAAIFGRAFVFHPAWSAAALLIMGALCGTAVRQWYQQDVPEPAQPVIAVPTPLPWGEQELEATKIEGIRVKPQENSAAPQVELQLRAEQPVILKGSPDDAEIRHVLTYVLEHSQRFDPRMRLDSLDVLRTRTMDPQVRSALSNSVRRDANPEVRIKALEALRGTGSDPNVRRAMLDALSRDDDSAVRVEALDGLLAGLGTADSSPPLDRDAIEILRDRMHHDADSYIRSRSATALGRLASEDLDSVPRPQYPSRPRR